MQRAGGAIAALDTLLELQASHLGPRDIGTLRDVVMQKRPRKTLSPPRLVGKNEAIGYVAPPEALQIHGEEGDVRAHVAVTQLVQLQAIEDAQPSSRQKMSSAWRSPWPSQTHPEATRSSSNPPLSRNQRTTRGLISRSHDASRKVYDKAPKLLEPAQHRSHGRLRRRARR